MTCPSCRRRITKKQPPQPPAAKSLPPNQPRRQRNSQARVPSGSDCQRRSAASTALGQAKALALVPKARRPFAIFLAEQGTNDLKAAAAMWRELSEEKKNEHKLQAIAKCVHAEQFIFCDVNLDYLPSVLLCNLESNFVISECFFIPN